MNPSFLDQENAYSFAMISRFFKHKKGPKIGVEKDYSGGLKDQKIR
jgi:hypothetical protein